jgi:hypothetical protein
MFSDTVLSLSEESKNAIANFARQKFAEASDPRVGGRVMAIVQALTEAGLPPSELNTEALKVAVAIGEFGNAYEAEVRGRNGE